MAENKKLFLDLQGLTTLWEKLKTTFTTKTEFSGLEQTVGGLNTSVGVINEEINSINTHLDTIGPKTGRNYSEALNFAQSLAEGAIIKVTTEETIDNNIYKAGLYIVDSVNGVKTIKYIGTNDGTGTEFDSLSDRVSTLENSSITGATIITGDTNNSISVIDNTLLIQYDDVFVPNSESINALTHAAVAKKIGELESVISGLPRFKFEVVDELPTNDISLSTIYLKKVSNNTENSYEEYIYIQNTGWEKLGEQKLDVSNFVTNDALSTMLTAYAKTSDVTTSIQSAIDEHNAIIAATYATKKELETTNSRIDTLEASLSNYATESSILESLQSNEEGSIGATIAIPLTEIEKLD